MLTCCRRAKPIEDREVRAEKGNAKSIRCLAPVRMSDEQIAALAARIRELPGRPIRTSSTGSFSSSRRFVRSDRGAEFSHPISVKPAAKRSRADRARRRSPLLAAEEEVAIQHCIDQLAALTAILSWNGNSADLRQESAISSSLTARPGRPIEEYIGDPVRCSSVIAAPRICSPMATVQQAEPICVFLLH